MNGFYIPMKNAATEVFGIFNLQKQFKISVCFLLFGAKMNVCAVCYVSEGRGITNKKKYNSLQFQENEKYYS